MTNFFGATQEISFQPRVRRSRIRHTMRPKYILWLIVAALSLFWYLLDPEARRSGTADIPTTTSTAATIHLGEAGLVHLQYPESLPALYICLVSKKKKIRGIRPQALPRSIINFCA